MIDMYVHTYIGVVTFFTLPPQNTTVCRDSDVTIPCEHMIVMPKPVAWVINGTSFDQEEVVRSPLYQLNNSTQPTRISLTVFSINGTTTFQCIVISTPNTTTSTHGTVTVTNGMYVPYTCVCISMCICMWVTVTVGVVKTLNFFLLI